MEDAREPTQKDRWVTELTVRADPMMGGYEAWSDVFDELWDLIDETSLPAADKQTLRDRIAGSNTSAVVLCGFRSIWRGMVELAEETYFENAKEMAGGAVPVHAFNRTG